jgi:hypothetical protein
MQMAKYFLEGERMNLRRFLCVILMMGLILALTYLNAKADPPRPYHHPHGNAYGWDGPRPHHHKGPRNRYCANQVYVVPPPVAYVAPVPPVVGIPYAPPQPQPYVPQPATPGLSGQFQFNF